MTTTTALWLVTRIIALPADSLPGQIETLAGLPGVQSVTPGKRRLTVTYDVREMQYGSLVNALGPRRAGLISRIRTAWFNNMDRNLADSLQIKVGACCNQPPVRR
ncbi:heavy-metal-associated domain-containing protein [Silvimonas sp.]|uniref:heavy-metal-associated domain-containing protein n=1 Tax=Silvimonas sp. TaxID=2650811 RepID=UPI00284621DA|nr:heavy-metal-associated domain-containing protein [Silvimonas sp.]MDR3428132.1 heavy-metal-associated domain-containing protein [Silvimonas sp.]